MNVEVAERLITNLLRKPIKHNQKIWLRAASDTFVVSSTDKWSCATSGCAAGFLFLEDAPVGSVFALSAERIFSSEVDFDLFSKSFSNYEDPRDYYRNKKLGTSVTNWGAEMLGITSTEAHDLFYDMSDTEGIVAKLRRLIREHQQDL